MEPPAEEEHCFRKEVVRVITMGEPRETTEFEGAREKVGTV